MAIEINGLCERCHQSSIIRRVKGTHIWYCQECMPKFDPSHHVKSFKLWCRRIWWDSHPLIIYRRFKAWQGIATDEKGRPTMIQGLIMPDGKSKRLPFKLPYPERLRDDKH